MTKMLKTIQQARFNGNAMFRKISMHSLKQKSNCSSGRHHPMNLVVSYKYTFNLLVKINVLTYTCSSRISNKCIAKMDIGFQKSVYQLD